MTTTTLPTSTIQPNEFTPKVCELLYTTAHNAGMAAVAAIVPRPMLIAGYAPILDGVCGFAWVNIRPANSRFAKWLVLNQYARKDSYAGGVRLSVHQFNQSMQRKEAYAYAFAEKLREYGVDCFADSRMD